MDFHGKTVFITGASRGIGAAAARAFWDKGANVVGIGRSSDDLRGIFTPFEERGAFFDIDIQNESDLKTAVDSTINRYGSIDVVVNNAAVLGPIAPLTKTATSDFAQTIQINLIAAYSVLHLCTPHLIASKGTAINISSGAAYGYLEGWTSYCTSKAGLLMLTQAFHTELSAEGVRVLGLSPGTVATQMQRVIKASGVGPVAELEWSDHRTPQSVAQALIWMCTKGADPYLGLDVKLRDEEVQKQVTQIYV